MRFQSLLINDEQVEKTIKEHLTKLIKLLTTVVLDGQQLKEFRTDSSAKELANLIVANLIGMITLTKCNISQSAKYKKFNGAIGKITSIDCCYLASVIARIDLSTDWSN